MISKKLFWTKIVLLLFFAATWSDLQAMRPMFNSNFGESGERVDQAELHEHNRRETESSQDSEAEQNALLERGEMTSNNGPREIRELDNSDFSSGGLSRNGADCFINSSLQLYKSLNKVLKDSGKSMALQNMPCLQRFFDQRLTSDRECRELRQEMAREVINKLDNRTQQVRSEVLQGVIEDGTAKSQQDALEFLALLLEDTEAPPLYFEEMLINQVANESRVGNPRSSRMLSLALSDNNLTLQQLINNEFESTRSQKWNDQDSNDVGVQRQLRLRETIPSTVVLSLGRYHSDGSKNITPISGVDQRITLPTTGNEVDITYKPVAIICHIGESLNAGHYICFRREGNEWQLFNDSLVLKESPYFTEDFISRNCYIIAYEVDPSPQESLPVLFKSIEPTQRYSNDADEKSDKALSEVKTDKLPSELERSAEIALKKHADVAAGEFEKLRLLTRTADGEIEDKTEQNNLRATILDRLKDYQDVVDQWRLETEKKNLGTPAQLEEAIKRITFSIIDKFDFRTEPNGAVFWTGYALKNQTTAIDGAARKTGKKTIEMTQDGKLLDQLQMYEPDSPILDTEKDGTKIKGKSKLGDALFAAASTKFAKGASGDVVAIVYNPDVLDASKLAEGRIETWKETYKKSAFGSIEEPILKAREAQGLLQLRRVLINEEITFSALVELLKTVEEQKNRIDSAIEALEVVKGILKKDPVFLNSFKRVKELEKEVADFKKQAKVLAKKEADLIQREKVLAEKETKNAETVKSQSNPSSTMTREQQEVTQNRASLEKEKKDLAKQTEELIKNVNQAKNTLGINVDKIEEPVILDSIYELIGRKLLGKPILQDRSEKLTSEEEFALEKNLKAKKMVDQSLKEVRRAWAKLNRWEKKHSSDALERRRSDSVESQRSTASQYSEIIVPDLALSERKQTLTLEEQKEQLVMHLNEKQQKSNEAEERLKELVPHGMTEEWWQKENQQLQIKLMEAYCETHRHRWMAAVEVQNKVALAQKAIDQASKQASNHVSSNASNAREQKEKAKEVWRHLALKERSIEEAFKKGKEVGEIALQKLLQQDQVVVRLWNNFLQPSQENKVGLMGSSQGAVKAEDFFKKVDETQRSELEFIALKEYKEALRLEKTEEAAKALLEENEENVKKSFKLQLLELRDRANKVASCANRKPNTNWDSDKRRREASRNIDIANAYKDAVTIFEREIERLHGIQHVWESKLEAVVTAYAQGDQGPWKNLTHEERRVTNSLMAKKNEKMRAEYEDALNKAQERVRQAQEYSKQTFFFTSSREEASKRLQEAEQELAELNGRNEAAQWGKLTPEGREKKRNIIAAQKLYDQYRNKRMRIPKEQMLIKYEIEACARAADKVISKNASSLVSHAFTYENVMTTFSYAEAVKAPSFSYSLSVVSAASSVYRAAIAADFDVKTYEAAATAINKVVDVINDSFSTAEENSLTDKLIDRALEESWHSTLETLKEERQQWEKIKGSSSNWTGSANKWKETADYWRKCQKACEEYSKVINSNKYELIDSLFSSIWESANAAKNSYESALACYGIAAFELKIALEASRKAERKFQDFDVQRVEILKKLQN